MRDLDNFEITDASRGAAFTVSIIPKANTQEVVGVMEDGTVKIRLTSPPVGGQENEELVAFLSELLNVAPGDVEIVAGLEKRKKLVSVLRISATQVDEIFRANASGNDYGDE